MTTHTKLTKTAAGMPLTLDEVRELLAEAERAGIRGDATLTAKVRIRDQRVVRLEVSST